MAFGGKARRPTIDRRQSLAGIPVLNDGTVLASEGAEDNVVVKVPLRRQRGFLGRLFPDVAEKQIKLDELGSFVIRHVDGKTSVLDIVEAFVKRFGVNRREAELSIAEFLKSLARRRVISIVIK